MKKIYSAPVLESLLFTSLSPIGADEGDHGSYNDGVLDWGVYEGGTT